METQKIILIAGGTGLIGSSLKTYFTDYGYKVRILSRQETNTADEIYHWNPSSNVIDPTAFKQVHTVINLSGSSILGGWWTKKRKEVLRSSRINSTRFLVEQLRLHGKISHFIQASAMGYFGNRGDELLDEDCAPGSDFMAKLCIDWESEAQLARRFSQLSIVRIGLFLHQQALLIRVLNKLSSFYIAAGFGSGKQYVNYTHTDEFNKLVHQIIEGNIPADIYHAVGREACTLNKFIEEIAGVNHSRVFLPNLPAFILKLVLGEASSALLNSHRIESKKLNGMNFHIYQSLNAALSSFKQK